MQTRLAFLIPLAALLAAATARAAEDTSIQVWTIRGTNADKEVAAELKSIEAELKKQTRCTGFKLLKQENGKADSAKPLVAAPITNYKAVVTPLERKGNRIKIDVEIKRTVTVQPGDKDGKDKKRDKEDKGGKPVTREETVTHTSFTIDAGTSQFVSVNYPGGGNDLLIIAVSAK
ncbi:MAG: hypothetical protein HZB38_17995 [Planctomycetes bacterium]|nr:hypothetical protein [Planctomycetota bacterium]